MFHPQIHQNNEKEAGIKDSQGSSYLSPTEAGLPSTTRSGARGAKQDTRKQRAALKPLSSLSVGYGKSASSHIGRLIESKEQSPHVPAHTESEPVQNLAPPLEDQNVSSADAQATTLHVSRHADRLGSVTLTVQDDTSGVQAQFQISPDSAGQNRHSSPVTIRSIALKQSSGYFPLTRMAKLPRDQIKIGHVIEVPMPRNMPDSQGVMVSVTRTPSIAITPRPIMQRYVVIGPCTDRTVTTALPIKPYFYRGVAAEGVVRSHHVVVYSGSQPPNLKPNEEAIRTNHGSGIDCIRGRPIKVSPYSPVTKLDPMSRLNLFDKVIIQTEAIYKIFGEVHRDSMGALLYQYQDVQQERRAEIMSPTRAATVGPVSEAQPTTSIYGSSSTRSPLLAARMEEITGDITRMQSLARSASIEVQTPTQNLVEMFALDSRAYEAYASRVSRDISAAIRQRQ